ncbi:MAG: DUF4254 domain-containing protein [bacterium]
MSVLEFNTIKTKLDSWTDTWNQPSEEKSHESWIKFLKRWRSRTDNWFTERSGRFFELVDDEINLPDGNSLLDQLMHLHLCNNVIWYFEDEARRKDASPEELVDVKRGIDAVNQKRNDQMEVLDEYFFHEIQGGPTGDSIEMHTEPPGLILDRLSIMSLKIFHYSQQNRSEEVGVLTEQREDLGQSFDRLMKDIQDGRKKIKIYRQYKSYNDPETNPVLEE